MNIIETTSIKAKLIEEIKQKVATNKKKSILVVSQSQSPEVIQYKNAIEKQCNNLGIEFIDLRCFKEEIAETIAYKINDTAANGFIILQPLDEDTNIDYLQSNIDDDILDLDCFTYKSLGMLMSKKLNNLPCTAQATIDVLKDLNIDLKSKKVVIANSTNTIGKPLALYLNTMKATVTLLNSQSKNQHNIIKDCDIFISAIGKANYYDSSYFTNDQLLIDLGMSYKDNTMYGDIDYNDLQAKDLNVDLIKNTKGIGAITTLTLLNKLFD